MQLRLIMHYEQPLLSISVKKGDNCVTTDTTFLSLLVWAYPFLALDQVWTIFYFILGTDNKTEIEQMQKLFVICCQFIDCLYSSPGKGVYLCLTISAINIFEQIGLLIG